LWGAQRWPLAAWGGKGEVYEVDMSMRPQGLDFDLRKFLEMPLRRLSTRAAAGFLSRAGRGRLRFADGFLDELQQYLKAETAGDQHEQMSLLPN
jgi:DNA (cytosine-5)-methyltransferase 1